MDRGTWCALPYFIIMLAITRSFIAALVIVGTVALSLGASFGLSVLIWQYVLGITLHWMVLPMSVIILLAVGSDYRSGRYHHRPGPAVRHLGRALIHDTVYPALLGRWFWWPQIVRPRPASQMLRDTPPRPVVRDVMRRDEYRDDAVTIELSRSRVP